jgi:hypothetical protein
MQRTTQIQVVLLRPGSCSPAGIVPRVKTGYSCRVLLSRLFCVYARVGPFLAFLIFCMTNFTRLRCVLEMNSHRGVGVQD